MTMRPALLLSCALLLLLLAGVNTARAQQPAPRDPADISAADELPGTIHITPEMWFYLQQQRRDDDPKVAIRRNAEQRAQERRARLAAMRWYGMSNQRPVASPVPYMATYSPTWSGTSWDAYRWLGGQPTVAIQVSPNGTLLK